MARRSSSSPGPAIAAGTGSGAGAVRDAGGAGAGLGTGSGVGTGRGASAGPSTGAGASAGPNAGAGSGVGTGRGAGAGRAGAGRGAGTARGASAPRWLRPAILALTAVLFFASTSGEVSDYDFWWHLKTGQYIVQQHKLPVPDEFAFTTYLGKPAYPQEAKVRQFNLTHEWLAQVIFYLAYAAAGFTGIVLLRSLLIAAFCGLLGWVVYGRTGSFYRGVAGALVAGTVAWQFVFERPYLITFALLAATIAIVDSRRRLWILPPLFLVWANCHSGFFLGWVVLGIYCAEALYRKLPDARRLLLISGISVLASGLNPNGFLVIPVLRWYQASALQASVAEWQYPLPWPPTPFSIALAGALAVMIWQRRRVRPADWLLLLAFGAASLSAVRNIILAATPGAIGIATYFPWKRTLPRIAEFALAGLLVMAGGARIAQGRSFQFRAAEWKFPAGAADFLLAHHVTVPMFNSYEMGGYLIWRLWPQERVFIDGRALNESVWRDYERIAFNAAAINGKSGEELLKQYGIDAIVMNGFDANGSVYLLPAALSDPGQTEWKLVYADAQAMVYMRVPPPGVQPLNPLRALGSLEAGCRVAAEHERGRPGCARGLADLFARIGDPVRARQWQAFYATRPE